MKTVKNRLGTKDSACENWWLHRIEKKSRIGYTTSHIQSVNKKTTLASIKQDFRRGGKWQDCCWQEWEIGITNLCWSVGFKTKIFLTEAVVAMKKAVQLENHDTFRGETDSEVLSHTPASSKGGQHKQQQLLFRRMPSPAAPSPVGAHGNHPWRRLGFPHRKPSFHMGKICLCWCRTLIWSHLKMKEHVAR